MFSGLIVFGCFLHNVVGSCQDDQHTSTTTVFWKSGCGFTQVPVIPANVTTVYLNNNNITSITRDSFTELTRLRELKLNENGMRHIERESFATLTLLRKLWLQNNKLTIITQSMLRNLTELEELKLHHNEIEHIDPNSFRDLVNLQKLLLGHNKLTTIMTDTFNGLAELKYLGLRYNSISDIKDGAFAQLTGLRTLKLSENNLTTLSSGVFNMTNITEVELSLSDNPLQCDSRMSWIKQGEIDRRIGWVEADQKPRCNNNPDMDWDSIMLGKLIEDLFSFLLK